MIFFVVFFFVFLFTLALVDFFFFCLNGVLVPPKYGQVVKFFPFFEVFV